MTPDEAGKENAGVTVVTPQAPVVSYVGAQGLALPPRHCIRPPSPEPEPHHREPHAALTGKLRLRGTRQVVRG